MTDDISKMFDGDGGCFLALQDFSKAFHLVDLTILGSKPDSRFGFHILVSLLFSIYLNYFASVRHVLSYHFYADDFQVYASFATYS